MAKQKKVQLLLPFCILRNCDCVYSEVTAHIWLAPFYFLFNKEKANMLLKKLIY